MFGKKSTQLFKTKNIKFKSFERSLCLIYLIAVGVFCWKLGNQLFFNYSARVFTYFYLGFSLRRIRSEIQQDFINRG